jgi:hypothetical protein
MDQVAKQERPDPLYAEEIALREEASRALGRLLAHMAKHNMLWRVGGVAKAIEALHNH